MRELVSTPAESMKTAQPGFIKNKEGNHMWMLLGSTVATSFLDSLNPSAIAQQMLLQAMVKNKRHIWFFIGGDRVGQPHPRTSRLLRHRRVGFSTFFPSR